MKVRGLPGGKPLTSPLLRRFHKILIHEAVAVPHLTQRVDGQAQRLHPVPSPVVDVVQQAAQDLARLRQVVFHPDRGIWVDRPGDDAILPQLPQILGQHLLRDRQLPGEAGEAGAVVVELDGMYDTGLPAVEKPPPAIVIAVLPKGERFPVPKVLFFRHFPASFSYSHFPYKY